MLNWEEKGQEGNLKGHRGHLYFDQDSACSQLLPLSLLYQVLSDHQDH